MKAQSECEQCFLRQADDAAQRLKLTETTRERMLTAVKQELANTATDVTPPVRASRVHAVVRQISNNNDPYREAKQQATEHALGLYEQLKHRIQLSADPLDTAVRLAIAGNIIDLGVASHYDLEASIEHVLHQPLAIDQMMQLKQAITDAKELLYLADNAGETVMDRLLIETIDKPVTYVVKGAPAVNDATREDAVAAGLDQVCEIIDNGAAILGTLLEQCNEALNQRFNSAELIIAKGMANYESLSGSRTGLFFLLQTKCAVIARHLGVAEKSIIVMEDSP
jgi:uncharacterized protein with ATP-grasp and redox domains